jgi:hypothetical protein
MSIRKSTLWSMITAGTTTSILGTLATAAAFTVIPAGSAMAQQASCAAAWGASTVYNGGNTASENGINYIANWWTQGDDPATHSGATGSGQPWTTQGACSATGGGGDDGGGGDNGGGDGGNGGTPTPPTFSSFVFSPYKDVTINLNWNNNVMQTKVTGTAIPVAGAGSLLSTTLPNLETVTLAFATGECGSESWGGVSADSFKSANIPTLDAAGVGYIISTGGASGTFTCSSATGLSNFIARYYSSHMVGVDFDIEGGQTQAQTDSLVAAVAAVQSQYPTLRFSFTVATLAASDGSYGGVNALGNQVIEAVMAAGIQHYTVNLMVMDFGRAQASNCVLKSDGLCDMGASTIQAVENLRHTYGIAPEHIEVTPMLGRNDTADEIFTLDNVDTVALYAAQNGLAGVHHWSLDRDTPCASPTDSASPICNSYSGPGALDYTKRFLSDLGY